jgi:hypothetical protein
MDFSGLCNVCEWVIQKVGMQEVNLRWFWVSAPLIMATIQINTIVFQVSILIITLKTTILVVQILCIGIIEIKKIVL